MSFEIKKAIKECEKHKALDILQSDKVLLCPCCGFDYTHSYSNPIIIKGNDNYDASLVVRGDIIAIPMYCEDGCLFTFCIGFHKGNNYLFGVDNGKWKNKPPKWIGDKS